MADGTLSKKSLRPPCRLGIRGAAPSRPNPAIHARAIGGNAERLWKRRPSPPAACPRGRFPRLHAHLVRSTEKQEGKKKNLLLLASPLPRIRSSLVDLSKPTSTAKPQHLQISPLRLPPSGIQTPSASTASIRRPWKINLQASAASNKRESTSIAEWMGGRGGEGRNAMHDAVCVLLRRMSSPSPPPLPESLNISSERRVHISEEPCHE